MVFDQTSLAMLTDFYEFTMAGGFLENKMKDRIGYYDIYFRSIPDGGGYVIMAGLELIVRYLQTLRFTSEDIAYLASKGQFHPDFLHYLEHMKFICDVYAVPEGTPVFPGEPLMIVRGPIIQAQLLETMLLLAINHQSLIATKACRIVSAAKGRDVMEFGARRAHGYSAALWGARAAYIAGCSSTSCSMADQHFGIPAVGTMAHSWVQMFESEKEAFRAYARQYPKDCVLLVDTYNVQKSGLPNAIAIFDEELKPLGIRPRGIRIDSGDITYLSIKARKMLDSAGYPDCKIVASNSLDEYIIRDMLLQGAQIDSFGVGERLITSKSTPVLGGVYKLAAIEENGIITPKIKLSENITKITTPCFKQVHRLYSNENGKAIADVVTLHDEEIDSTGPYEIFDPEHVWKRKVITDFHARALLVQIFDQGRLVYRCPTVAKVREYCLAQTDTLWDEVKRFENPHRYYVDLSQKLWDMKLALINQYKL